jgi:hypothetical protein
MTHTKPYHQEWKINFPVFTEASIADRVEHLCGLKETSSSAVSSRQDRACPATARSTSRRTRPSRAKTFSARDNSEEALSLADFDDEQ